MIGYPLGLPQKIADGAVVKGFNEKKWKNPLQSTIKRNTTFTLTLMPLFEIQVLQFLMKRQRKLKEY